MSRFKSEKRSLIYIFKFNVSWLSISEVVRERKEFNNGVLPSKVHE
jgi:hypothetical protein